jgi:hypothetical protein
VGRPCGLGLDSMSRKQRYVPSVPGAHHRGRRKPYAKPAPPEPEEPEEPEEPRETGVHRDRLAEHFARREALSYAWDRIAFMTGDSPQT